MGLGAVGAILAFAYIAAPEMYRRATEPLLSAQASAVTATPVEASTDAQASPPSADAQGSPPSAPTAESVHLTLSFSGTAAPQEVEAIGIHWAYAIVGPDLLPNALGGTSNTIPGLDLGSVNDTHITIIFLVFDRSIQYDNLRLTPSGGATLPAWDMSENTDRVVLLTIHGTITGTVTIEPVTTTMSPVK